ncbi:MAG: beta-eliminating lyase-related protein [Chitinophagaceae bacterium]
MLEAMMQATVGDDVFGEDITVNELENKAANLFGMEAGTVLSKWYNDQSNSH